MGLVILNEVKNPVLHIEVEVPLGFFTSFRMTFIDVSNNIMILLILFNIYEQNI
jgi:hypothetical protein